MLPGIAVNDIVASEEVTKWLETGGFEIQFEQEGS
jgi:hypothetical protein